MLWNIGAGLPHEIYARQVTVRPYNAVSDGCLILFITPAERYRCAIADGHSHEDTGTRS
jgi:hypothetical protein